jgi:hypothetical protein
LKFKKEFILSLLQIKIESLNVSKYPGESFRMPHKKTAVFPEKFRNPLFLTPPLLTKRTPVN